MFKTQQTTLFSWLSFSCQLNKLRDYNSNSFFSVVVFSNWNVSNLVCHSKCYRPLHAFVGRPLFTFFFRPTTTTPFMVANLPSNAAVQLYASLLVGQSSPECPVRYSSVIACCMCLFIYGVVLRNCWFCVQQRTDDSISHCWLQDSSK